MLGPSEKARRQGARGEGQQRRLNEARDCITPDNVPRSCPMKNKPAIGAMAADNIIFQLVVEPPVFCAASAAELMLGALQPANSWTTKTAFFNARNIG